MPVLCENCNSVMLKDYCLFENNIKICKYCFCHDRNLYNNLNVDFKQEKEKNCISN